MYNAEMNRIRLTRGDTFRANVFIEQDGEQYEVAERDEIRFAMKRNYHDKKTAISKVIPNDTLLLELTPEETKSLEFGTYYYDIQMTFANGDVDTFIVGELDLLPEVE